MSGPLTAVSEAIAHGAVSRADIARRAGLDPSVVDASLDHLIRMGRITTEQLSSGCPDGGCGGCPSGKADGSAGCGASAPANARGPVLLKLTRRPSARANSR
ncbi:FeoC-like transcriptional regulator [Blastococcus sp. Marseille-P5729]|uniref:FeoC-like transcriptional regulator n=1 Tax=Blastococcus sp. Marseille-P5729 TaxID=2086582 RepID=UPI0018FEC357|nr:FeoC-like transcriptional regulator [Blastococcus sp. Marseille-P5729]